MVVGTTDLPDSLRIYSIVLMFTRRILLLTFLGELAALWMLDSASNTKKTRMRAST
jgi:hypothetical protein